MTKPTEVLEALLDQARGVERAVDADPDFHMDNMMEWPAPLEPYEASQGIADRIADLVSESASELTTAQLKAVWRLTDVSVIDWDRTEDLGNTKDAVIVNFGRARFAAYRALTERGEPF